MLFFKEMPQALTLLGAACMLLSVILMAIPSRMSEAKPEKPVKAAVPVGPVDAEAQPSDGTDEIVDTVDTVDTVDGDDTESLGSFVASEVSFRSSKVRRRAQHFPKAAALAERIGAAFPVVAMSG